MKNAFTGAGRLAATGLVFWVSISQLASASEFQLFRDFQLGMPSDAAIKEFKLSYAGTAKWLIEVRPSANANGATNKDRLDSIGGKSATCTKESCETFKVFFATQIPDTQVSEIEYTLYSWQGLGRDLEAMAQLLASRYGTPTTVTRDQSLNSALLRWGAPGMRYCDAMKQEEVCEGRWITAKLNGKTARGELVGISLRAEDHDLLQRTRAANSKRARQ